MACEYANLSAVPALRPNTPWRLGPAALRPPDSNLLVQHPRREFAHAGKLAQVLTSLAANNGSNSPRSRLATSPV